MARPRIIDEFTDLPVSNQRKWQLRKSAQGLCIICGNPKDHESAEHCATHYLAMLKRKRVPSREYARVRFGYVTRYMGAKSYEEEK